MKDREFLIPLSINFDTEYLLRNCRIIFPDKIYHCDVTQIRKWLDLLDDTLEDAPQQKDDRAVKLQMTEVEK